MKELIPARESREIAMKALAAKALVIAEINVSIMAEAIYEAREKGDMKCVITRETRFEPIAIDRITQVGYSVGETQIDRTGDTPMWRYEIGW